MKSNLIWDYRLGKITIPDSRLVDGVGHLFETLTLSESTTPFTLVSTILLSTFDIGGYLHFDTLGDAMSSARPVTSKARGICRYYTTPQGCFAGRTCKFLHGKEEKITPYDKSKTCKFYAAGYCKRGAKCWFVHAQPDASSSGFAAVEVPDTDEYEHICCICYEEPVTYGLLGE